MSQSASERITQQVTTWRASGPGQVGGASLRSRSKAAKSGTCMRPRRPVRVPKALWRELRAGAGWSRIPSCPTALSPGPDVKQFAIEPAAGIIIDAT